MMIHARTASFGSDLQQILLRTTSRAGGPFASRESGKGSGPFSVVDRTGSEDWDERLGEETEANLYAFRPWGTYKARLNWTVRRIEIRSEDGRALAYVQYQVRRVGPARFVLVQGGPILTAAGAARAEPVLRAFLDHLALGRFDLLGVNFHAFQNNEAVPALVALGFVPVVSPRHHTLEVDLTQDLEAILAGTDPKWRRNLAKARSNPDLEVVIPTEPDARRRAFDRFTAMYAALQARKGFSNTLNPEAFRDIAATDPRLVVLEVRECGETILVRIAHRARTRWTDFFAASNDRGRATNAAALSVWSLVERAREEGCPIYDLGGIDPAGNRGVYHFKRGLSRRVVQSTPLWLYGRTGALRSVAAALLAQR
ncbi:lipid II:glycine glycyltransferase FemX [Methylobacterium sp. Leaf118]|uniref:lipid II:glycine glycyltransferase FemX n=1 Tax=Methylobacterium sp. Leaf118 TaxID=2876562 RepID=UPI001E55F997|nr:GNAT family N-acetyltransferase [Methylobacterium sp. Leaf118]